MKTTTNYFLALFAILLLFSCTSETRDSGYPHLDLASFVYGTMLDAVNDSFESAAEGKVVVAAYFETDGKKMVEQKYYFSNDGNDLPDDSTIFQIGSVTKTFTAALLAQKAASGDIDLTDPAQNYFPPVGVPPVGPELPTTFGATPVTITLEQLASHNAGFARNLPNNGSSTPYRWGFTQLETEPLYYEPGDNCYIYSNFSFGLCGVALSYQAYPGNRNYFQKFEDVMIDNLLNPLGMNDTRISLDAGQEARRAIGYNKNSGAADYELKSWPFNHAGGALYSSITDMMIYGKEMTGEGAVLSPAEITDIFTVRNKTYRDTCEVDNPGFSAWQTLGWTENRDMRDSLGGSFSRYNKNGSTNGFSAYITLATPTLYGDDKRAFVVVLANRADFPVSSMGADILKELFALESKIVI